MVKPAGKRQQVEHLVERFESTLGGDPLGVFANTHPHRYHLCGLAEIVESIASNEVWHSGHKPSRTHDEAHRE